MTAPLALCTKEERRAVIRFLWWEGVSGAEIYRRFLSQYEDIAQPRRNVYEWTEKFKCNRTCEMHEKGAGRPSIFTTDEKTQQARHMVMANRQVTLDDVACSLRISYYSAF